MFAYPSDSSAFFRSNFVTLLVRFSGFDLNDRFEKKFCRQKTNEVNYYRSKLKISCVYKNEGYN